MWSDVLDLEEFYGSTLGQMTARLLRARGSARWRASFGARPVRVIVCHWSRMRPVFKRNSSGARAALALSQGAKAMGTMALVESVSASLALSALGLAGMALSASEAAFLGSTGLMIGIVGTIPAHELTHRTWDPVSMLIGRWLLAFSFDTIFSVEHVYGHHRYVSTRDDPATAPARFLGPCMHDASS